MSEELDFDSAAILVWLEPGKHVTPEFDPYIDTPGFPSPNPSVWWRLQPAIVNAMTHDVRGKLLPWIKTGSRVLSPNEIAELYDVLSSGTAGQMPPADGD